jgi:hypothetical protein
MHVPLRVAVKDHLGESVPYARALVRAGHQIVRNGPADVLLIDLDAPRFGFRPIIDHFKAGGAKVLLYPHGAGTMLGHDGLWEPYEHVDANLVVGPGQAELARRMEYPAATHVTGWSLCEQRPFRPRADVRHVVFGPTHPAGDGSLADSHREMNAETFARLLEGPWRLTVRHIGTLEQNGLWHADGVTFVTGKFDAATAEIDTADAVVAGDGTFPSLAIARGVPTVICGQGHPPMYGIPGEPVPTLRFADRYMDFIRYPLDASDGPLDEVVHAAARSEAPIAEWKRRFVGEPLDEAAFASLVERIAWSGGPAAIDETRAFTVAALADEVLERPELLAAYAAAFGPDDDATLIVWGLGLEDEALLAGVQSAAVAAGLDADRLPDILLLPLEGGADADRRLAERADALLSDWPGAGRLGELPRYRASDGAALRAAAYAPALSS